ncbi:hypothetical protein HO173_004327 [Letharia columbiana]|uniref:N-acetyltransferase domain-containing protein n=1 Tax=Letharia columbiana TaxID=112416 RepID=A0A8H6L6F6_9LECA|nr:uncharacterized protein HO173_004327 [Letharia columbiana]KAF6237437.1 hypothetical protein HO173_004327 [Letharia columbiana]
MSDFALSPATLPDLPGIAKVSTAAMIESRHTMSYWMFPPDNENAIYEWRLNGITNTFNNISYCIYTKLVDTKVGKIVAFALWEAPHPPETEEEKAKKEQEKKENGDKDDKLPKGTKAQLLHDFDAETQRMRAKYVDREKDYILRAIATLPEYQGKGCASKLLQSGLKKIDAEGAKTWLEATPQGQSLYAKFGWKVVDEIIFDLEKYGCGEWVQRTTVMNRKAQM